MGVYIYKKKDTGSHSPTYCAHSCWTLTHYTQLTDSPSGSWKRFTVRVIKI